MLVQMNELEKDRTTFEKKYSKSKKTIKGLDDDIKKLESKIKVMKMERRNDELTS